jgi:hypothetical protein
VHILTRVVVIDRGVGIKCHARALREAKEIVVAANIGILIDGKRQIPVCCPGDFVVPHK